MISRREHSTLYNIEFSDRNLNSGMVATTAAAATTTTAATMKAKQIQVYIVKHPGVGTPSYARIIRKIAHTPKPNATKVDRKNFWAKPDSNNSIETVSINSLYADDSRTAALVVLMKWKVNAVGPTSICRRVKSRIFSHREQRTRRTTAQRRAHTHQLLNLLKQQMWGLCVWNCKRVYCSCSMHVWILDGSRLAHLIKW